VPFFVLHLTSYYFYSGQATPIGGKPFGLAVSPTEPGVAVTGTFDQKALTRFLPHHYS